MCGWCRCVVMYPAVLTVYPDVRTQIVVLDIPQECVTQYKFLCSSLSQ